MSLATELADAVGADAEERQFLVNVALDVGQWLADRGVPGRWDKVKPAAVLRCLDFLAPKERERVLFSMAGLLGHAAFHGRLSPRSARQSLAEIVGLSQDDAIRSFARTASEQLQEMTA